MLKKIIIPLLAAASFSCGPRHAQLVPADAPCFRSLTMKFSFRDGETRQNGRVLWRFDAGSSKFIFFNALNQSGLELNVSGEEAVLVNISAKSFWTGDFSHLLDRIWGIHLPLAAWKELLLLGKVSRSLLAENGIEASMDGGADDGGPRNIRLRRGSAELVLRVLKNDLRPGKIVMVDYAGRYRAAGLEDVLER